MTPEAADFLARAVDTIHQLEILMLLRQSPERVWRVDEIAIELGMVPATVSSSIRGLHAHGVLSVDDTRSSMYRYGPGSVHLHAGIEALAAAYENDPLAVIKAVLDKPTRAVRTFSSAFSVRRPRD